jgi:hypothetical protein
MSPDIALSKPKEVLKKARESSWLFNAKGVKSDRHAENSQNTSVKTKKQNIIFA